MTRVRRKEISNVPERMSSCLDLSWIGEATRSRSDDCRSSSETLNRRKICVFLQQRQNVDIGRKTLSGAGAKQDVTCADNQEEGLDAKISCPSQRQIQNVDALQQIRKRSSIQTSSSHMLCMIRDAAREQAARSER